MKIASALQFASLSQIRQATHKIALQYQQAEISITTKEGDRISISNNFFSRQKIGFQGYGDGQKLFAAQATIGKNDFLQVQGDLSPEELADLGKLLDDLSQIAGDFFDGNLKGAAVGVMNLGDMGSLAKLDAPFTNTLSLATALADYHPLPASTADLFSNLLADDKDKPPTRPNKDELSVGDHLLAQWRQFLNYLENQTAKTGDETAGHDNSSAKASDIKNIGQAMLTRVRNTLQGHPRLSPLVPAVSNLALNNAGQDFIKDIRHNFKDAFRSWMM